MLTSLYQYELKRQIEQYQESISCNKNNITTLEEDLSSNYFISDQAHLILIKECFNNNIRLKEKQKRGKKVNSLTMEVPNIKFKMKIDYLKDNMFNDYNNEGNGIES